MTVRSAARRVVVVPCFNEAARLDADALCALADARTKVFFVDDGSTDDTLAILKAAMVRHSNTPHAGDIKVLLRPVNEGKGEAVRRGLLDGIEVGADVVAYLDADLSTPIDEMRRVLRVLEDRDDVDVVLGSRVALLGRDVERSAARHYLGRVFATVASTTLGLRVYDTQCGAKAFRVTPALEAALERPFASRWAFDVELLGRLLDHGAPATAFFELPLERWRHKPGSKLTPVAMIRAGIDVLALALHRRK